MCNIVFLEIGTKIAEECALYDNSRQTIVEIEKLGLSRIPHPPYSPDLSRCDFSLFGFLKERAKGTQHGRAKKY
jgi:hypothetical protein